MTQQTEQAGQQPGRRLFYGETLNALSDGKLSCDSGVVALGTTLATAYKIICAITEFGTVSSSTGAALPSALTLQQTKSPDFSILNILGKSVEIYNDGAQTLTIYAPDGSTIDGTAGATGVTLTTAHRGAQFRAIAVTAAGVVTWKSALLGAATT